MIVEKNTERKLSHAKAMRIAMRIRDRRTLSGKKLETKSDKHFKLEEVVSELEKSWEKK